METLTYKLKDDREFIIKVLKQHKFGSIDLFICSNYIVYHSSDLFSMDITGKFKFGGPRMEEQMKTYLPMDFFRYEGADNYHFLVIKKNPNLLLLRDLLTHMGQIEARHAVWMIGTLFNLCCYLEYAKIIHKNINLDTYYIDPLMHSGALLGDWWTAYEEEKTKKDSEPFDRFKAALLDMPETSSYSDLIKRIGKEILGDAKDAPAALLEYLNTPSKDTVQKEYALWPTILQKSFGPRRFVELKVSKDDLYKI